MKQDIVDVLEKKKRKMFWVKSGANAVRDSSDLINLKPTDPSDWWRRFVVLEIWRRWMCQLVSFPSNFCAHLIKLMAILPRSALCCLWHLQLHLTLPHSQVFPVSIRINCSILPPLLYARHSTVCVRVGYDGFVGSQIWKQPHLSDTQPRWSGYPSALEMRFEMFSPFSNLLLTHALSWHQVSFYLSSSSNPSSPQWQKIRKLTKKQVVSSNIFPRLLFQLYGNLL